MSFCNFNSKSDGRRYDFFFHLNTALPFPVQNLVQRLRSQTPSSVSSTPNKVSAIPCELYANTLRALFLKIRDFFLYCEIFLTNTRGPLRCLLGIWSSGPKPCGGNNGNKRNNVTSWDRRGGEYLHEKTKLGTVEKLVENLKHRQLSVYCMK